jgi:hypothetical protein
MLLLPLTRESTTYPQDSKVFGLKEDPWRVKEVEATKNGLRVRVIDLGKLSGRAAIFFLYLLDVLVTEVSNSTEVDREQYD